jgi:hypothetical protein
MSKRVSNRVANRTTCCPMCTTPVLPEVNALFNHLLESHYSKQQRVRETCVRQCAHICTALLCIRRSVEAIVAQLPRVAAPAAAQPPAPDPPIQPPPVALLLPPPTSTAMSAPTPPGVAQATVATTSVPQQEPQLIMLAQRLAALEASVAANARAAGIAAEQARETAAATTEQVSQEEVDSHSHFSINCLRSAFQQCNIIPTGQGRGGSATRCGR